MLPRDVLERFEKKSAVTVMGHVALMQALNPDWMEEVFEKNSDSQYTRELMFSTVVGLMTLVSLGLSPSIHAAAKRIEEELGVSMKSVYNKIAGVETAVVRELVRGSAERFIPVLETLQPKRKKSVKGFKLRIVDGNHLAASEKRLKVLRKFRGAALPAQTLVVYDPDQEMIVDVLPWEDAHTQERVIMHDLLDRVMTGELWIADRNFCCAPILLGLMEHGAHFLVREHGANPNPKEETKLRRVGKIETGIVHQQIVSIKDDDGVVHRMRRIEVHLETPTEDGDMVIRLLTSVPSSTLGAKELARLYRRRWRIEAMFQRLEDVLQSEIKGLGQPLASLFAFGVSILAFNVLSLLMSAVRVRHAKALEESKIELSPYYVALEIRANYAGMMIATDAATWQRYEQLSTKELAQTMLRLAGNVNPKRLRSHPRKPKDVPKKGYVAWAEAQRHVSTCQVLEAGEIV
jgi:IS4 transposase